MLRRKETTNDEKRVVIKGDKVENITRVHALGVIYCIRFVKDHEINVSDYIFLCIAFWGML